MIDEKKFMEFITALEDAGAEYVSFDDLRKFVDEFPKIGDWILCSERLPEERQDVLVFDNYNNMYIASRVFKTFFDDEMNYINAIAWQPLPKAYHG